MASWAPALLTSPPDPFRLTQLCQLCQSVYADNLILWKGPNVSGIVKAFDGPPRAYVLVLDGVKVCCIEGTTVFPWQYLGQEAGWVNPAKFGPAGIVNSFVLATAQNIFPALPNDIEVFVGHSFGGAIASVLAAMFWDAMQAPAAVLTFGAPRTYAGSISVPAGIVPQMNVIAPLDPVPYIAPAGYADFNWSNPGSFTEIFGPVGSSPNAPVQADPDALIGMIAAGGLDKHATSNYLNLLTGLPGNPIHVPAPLLGRSATMPSFYAVRIQGVIAGQSAQNTLYYAHVSTTVPTALQVVTAIRNTWRTIVIPKVNSAYSILSYTAAHIEGVKLYTVNANTLARWRTNDAAVLAGNASDVGLKVDSPAPSFVAFGFTKHLGPWLWSDDDSTVEFAGLPKGSMRLPGVGESDTIDNDNDKLNYLTVARLADMDAIGENLESIIDVANGVNLRMAVMRKEFEGAAIQKPAGTGAFHYATINTLAPNPFITSQVSRKQSINRLG